VLLHQARPVVSEHCFQLWNCPLTVNWCDWCTSEQKGLIDVCGSKLCSAVTIHDVGHVPLLGKPRFFLRLLESLAAKGSNVSSTWTFSTMAMLSFRGRRPSRAVMAATRPVKFALNVASCNLEATNCFQRASWPLQWPHPHPPAVAQRPWCL